MAIDVTAETRIRRPRAEVAAYVTNPQHDPVWIGGISESRTVAGSGADAGSRVARVASFLGRRIEYVNEVVEHEPGQRLVMRSVAGPFPMTVTYEFEDCEFDDGAEGTAVRVRNQGSAGLLYRLAGPLFGLMVRQRVSSDLRTLKRLLEGDAGSDEARGERS